MSSIVRPEFGDSLPTWLGPKWRALGRLPRGLIIAVAMIAALLVIYMLLGGGSSKRNAEVAVPVAFRLSYDGDLLMARLPLGRESLRLETPASVSAKRTFAVQPLILPAYQGAIEGVLPLQAERLTRQMSAADPSLITIAEGPILLEEQPGYELYYQFSRGGRTVYGRRVLIFPLQPGARAGVDLTMTGQRNSQTQTAGVLAQQPPLREPFESLVVGN